MSYEKAGTGGQTSSDKHYTANKTADRIVLLACQVPFGCLVLKMGDIACLSAN